MPVALSEEMQAKIRERTKAGESASAIARRLGISRHSVRRYSAVPMFKRKPPASHEMPAASGTLKSQIAQKFGSCRVPFRMKDIRAAFPERHRVLVARMVRQLLDEGVLGKLGHSIYVGRCQ